MKQISSIAVALIWAAELFVLSSLPNRAAADIECDQGYRPPNASERAFFAEVRELLAALPAAPPGWKINEEDDGLADPIQMCKDTDALPEGAPFSVTISRSYMRSDMQERMKKADDAIAKARAWIPSAAQKRTIDEDNAKANAAMKKMTAAIDRGDQVAEKKYMDEYQKFGTAANKLQGKAMAEATALFQRLMANTSATVKVRINIDMWDSNYEHPSRLAVSGVSAAYREMIPKEDREDQQGNGWSWTTVLLGPWTNTESTDDPYLRFRARLPDVPGGTAFESFFVRIEADRATADALLAGLPIEKFKTMMRRAPTRGK